MILASEERKEGTQMINGLDKNELLEIYRLLILTRITEEKMVEYHQHTALQELPHAGIGQEAIAIGTCYGLSNEDQIIPSLRTRGAFLAKGVSSRVMMAGAFGKVGGPARGKNTSHHMGDKKLGVIAGTGVVAGHLPTGVGAALAAKLQNKDFVTVVYFGDGATNRGDFHEALNMAAIWDLPIVFVCENNGYAISTPQSAAMRIVDIADRALAYGMPGQIVDGNDVLAVYAAAQQAYKRARAGQGPTLLECKTYRWRGHSERDPRDLRPTQELEAWKQQCPIKKFHNSLIAAKAATEDELADIIADSKNEVEDAIRFAEQSPYPPAAESLLNVYAEERY